MALTVALLVGWMLAHLSDDARSQRVVEGTQLRFTACGPDFVQRLRVSGLVGENLEAARISRPDAVSLVPVSSTPRQQIRGATRWAAMYAAVGQEQLRSFDFVVVEPTTFGRPAPRSDKAMGGGREPLLIAYVSLGEVSEKAELYPDVAGKSWLWGRNAAWDSWMIDIRHGEWQQIFLDRLVGRALEAGFDGVMVDTLESSLYLSEKHKVKHEFIAAAQMIFRSFRARHPDAVLLLNGGLEVAVASAEHIDGVIVESLAARVEALDPKGSNAPEILAYFQSLLRAGQLLPLFALEYPERSSVTNACLCQFFAQLGMRPYFADQQLLELEAPACQSEAALGHKRK